MLLRLPHCLSVVTPPHIEVDTGVSYSRCRSLRCPSGPAKKDGRRNPRICIAFEIGVSPMYGVANRRQHLNAVMPGPSLRLRVNGKYSSDGNHYLMHWLLLSVRH